MKINASHPKQALKRAAQAGRLAFHASKDAYRFWRHASLSVFDSSHEQISARIMYNVHALEKGLAHETEWRPGRGRRALQNLNDALAMHRKHGYDESSFAFREGLAIIQRYIERHEGYPATLDFLPAIIDPSFLNAEGASTSQLAGVKIVRRSDKEENAAKGFHELSHGRSSVRAFSGGSVNTNKVDRALASAEKTPSVCNRQGWRVYWTENKDLAREVLKHQRGFGYPQMPEVLLTITVSNSSFISPVERNQGYIDGGLYSMSVLYGLEAEGLAAVPLNACLYAKDRKAIQHLLTIAPSDEIIMFIAIGHHPDATPVPVSDRRPYDDFLRRR